MDLRDGGTIRKGRASDLDIIKAIADASRSAIGFVPRPALARGVECGWMLVAQSGEEVIGFANYRHRQDHQTTLYEICVAEGHRRDGIGHAMLRALIKESRKQGKTVIRLKCPMDSEANSFYRRAGFLQSSHEPGKIRPLACWERQLGEDGSQDGGNSSAGTRLVWPEEVLE